MDRKLVMRAPRAQPKYSRASNYASDTPYSRRPGPSTQATSNVPQATASNAPASLFSKVRSLLGWKQRKQKELNDSERHQTPPQPKEESHNFHISADDSFHFPPPKLPEFSDGGAQLFTSTPARARTTSHVPASVSAADGGLSMIEQSPNQKLAQFFKNKGDAPLSEVEKEGVLSLIQQAQMQEDSSSSKYYDEVYEADEGAVLAENDEFDKYEAVRNAIIDPSANTSLRSVQSNSSILSPTAQYYNKYEPHYTHPKSHVQEHKKVKRPTPRQFSQITSAYPSPRTANRNRDEELEMTPIKAQNSVNDKDSNLNLSGITNENSNLSLNSLTASPKPKSSTANALLSLLDDQQSEKFSNPYSSTALSQFQPKNSSGLRKSLVVSLDEDEQPEVHTKQDQEVIESEQPKQTVESNVSKGPIEPAKRQDQIKESNSVPSTKSVPSNLFKFENKHNNDPLPFSKIPQPPTTSFSAPAVVVESKTHVNNDGKGDSDANGNVAEESRKLEKGSDSINDSNVSSEPVFPSFSFKSETEKSQPPQPPVETRPTVANPILNQESHLSSGIDNSLQQLKRRFSFDLSPSTLSYPEQDPSSWKKFKQNFDFGL